MHHVTDGVGLKISRPCSSSSGGRASSKSREDTPSTLCSDRWSYRARGVGIKTQSREGRVPPRSVECQCLSGGLGQRTGRSSSYSVRIRSGTRRRLSRPRCRCSRGGHLKSGEARTSRPQRPVPEQLAGCSYSRPRTRAAPCRWACMPAKCRRGHWRSPRKAESPPQGRRSLGLPFSSAVELRACKCKCNAATHAAALGILPARRRSATPAENPRT